jgi:two-component system chemotaxis response regulator CheY
MNILIVDDSQIARRINANVVKSIIPNAKIFQAENGAEALAILNQNHPKMFDLLLLDFNMPHMGGLETLKAINKKEEFIDLPIIMVTTEAHRDLIIEMIKLGVVDYLTKPFSAQDFRFKVIKHTSWKA